MTTYFWKKNDETFHWYLQCSQIPIHVRGAPDWVISDQRPTDRQQCRECRERDIVHKISPKP
ncbi:MAG: hypothetical protein V1726_08025 [Methanobacteriota archaeon]